MENEEIIEGFLNDNRIVIEQCYKDIRPMIANLVTKNSGNEDDIDEILQDSFIVFFEYCQREDFVLTSRFSTFIYRIAYNKWMKELNRRGRQQAIDQLLENIPDSDDNILPNDDINSSVFKVFRKIADGCQKIIQLKYLEGLSHQDIALELGITEQYSRLKLNRCKEKLAQLLINQRKK